MLTSLGLLRKKIQGRNRTSHCQTVRGGEQGGMGERKEEEKERGKGKRRKGEGKGEKRKKRGQRGAIHHFFSSPL